jgi:hypothetical protein
MRFSSILVIVVVSIAFAAIGCTHPEMPAATLAALTQADQYELLSLDPSHEHEKAGGDFHGWRVLGRTLITDTATRDKLTSALRAGVKENVDGMVAGCFNPRHGIRVTRGGGGAGGGQATDFVICFQCMSMSVYQGEQQAGSILTTSSPQPTFDAVLRAKGVTLASKDGGGK